MPRVRRRAKGRRSDLTAEQWDEITDGPDSVDLVGRSTFSSPIAKRRAWVAHRTEIMAAHAEPHYRPSLWWAFDSPREPRRVVGWTEPRRDVRPDDIRATAQPIYETDLAYLERLGLATPAEIEYLARYPEMRERGVVHLRPIDLEAVAAR